MTSKDVENTDHALLGLPWGEDADTALANTLENPDKREALIRIFNGVPQKALHFVRDVNNTLFEKGILRRLYITKPG